MKTILVLGAGRSSSALIAYLFAEARENNWKIIVADFSEMAAAKGIEGLDGGLALAFDIYDEQQARTTILMADVVISLLPAHLHSKVASHCLALNKHLLTASYVSAEMEAFHEESKTKGLLFLNECGLDPGIDHMSAMQVLDKIKANGGKIISFESFTGGLIAPESDPGNPWRYKFTWNPRNVVMAGQATAKFLQDGKYKYIPYQQLFLRTVPVHVSGYGDYDGYANRDSLKYIATYGLQEVKTMLRGTLRNKGFCKAWNIFVQLGCCDDTYQMDNISQLTHREFIDAFLEYDPSRSIEKKVMDRFGLNPQSPELEKLKWSGFFDDMKIGMETGTPAQILEHILTKKWKLQKSDHDLIVMWHRFIYEVNGKEYEIQASLIAKGDGATTAMAKTVGLPLAIATKLLLQGKIRERGVCIPIKKEFYDPILNELKLAGIELIETEIP